MIAPTYAANGIAFLFLLAQMFGLDIPYTPEEVEGAVTVIGVIFVQLLTMFRQWWTGRATLGGSRPQ